MNVKLLAGIVLFVIGLLTAVGGILGVGQFDRQNTTITVEGNRSMSLPNSPAASALPWIAGLSLAVGGALIGLSLGNFQHPRTHLEPGDQIVDPEGYHKMKHV